MKKLLRNFPEILSGARKVVSGGGPQLIRVVSVSEPRGVLVPTSELVLEVKARNGRVARLTPELPVPWPYAWTIRAARRLGVPVVSSLKPESFGFEVPLRRRSGSSLR